MAIPSRIEYENLLYSLQQTHPEIISSTPHLYSTSILTAIVWGEIVLQNGIEIRVLEVLNFKEEQIEGYSYAFYLEGVKIRWYDPQPHPENPDLAPNFPHHYHEEPNIKHNRISARGFTFSAPNFSQLIADSLQL